MKIKRDTSRKKSSKDQKLVKMNIDIVTLDILCRFVLSESSFIRTGHLSNLRKLIASLDPSTYISDIEKEKRVKFISEALKARLDYHLKDKTMIMVQVNGSLDFNVDFVDMNSKPMDNNELEWVIGLFELGLKYNFIYDNIDDIQDVCTRFMATDYANKGNIVQEFEAVIDKVKNDFRQVTVENNSVDMTFSLRDGVFEDVITDTYNIVTNPNRRLICGMSGLNDMVGGGFEAGRVYMLFGLGGVGKSLTLLNLITQFKKYNTHYKTKDPTKTPCVVLLTMENTVVETITRLFSMTDPNGRSMIDYESVDDVLRVLREDGHMTLDKDSPIDIIIKYKPNKSIDTSYLYTMYEDLADEGYEMICLIQDHVKRIRSIYNAPELRIELGDIVNEMKVFAAEMDIPVITVSHLNRDAAKIMEGGNLNNAGGTADVTMKMGKSNVGESLLMIDNLDCGIIINLEFDKNGNRFLVYSLIKMRDKVERTYIAQPFEYGSTIKLVEDVGFIPAFKTSLKDPVDKPRTASIRVANTAVKGVDAIISDTHDEDNAFSEQGPLILEHPDNIEEVERPRAKMQALYWLNEELPPMDKFQEKLRRLQEQQS